jgi:hypothetical protein
MKFFPVKSLAFAIGVFIALLSCNGEKAIFNRKIEKPLVEKAIHSAIGWAKNKNLNLLHFVIANDSNFIEVDPDGNVVSGFQDFRKAENFWMSDDFKAIKYEIRDLKINFSNSGSVAWFFCILDDINEWRGQPANWENTRWTGVLEKRNGNWVIVQMHFSMCIQSEFKSNEPEAKIPRKADISISGIYLQNSHSLNRILGNPPEPVEFGDDFPVIEICNSDKTEILSLVFHYGCTKNSISEIRIRPFTMPSHCMMQLKRVDHFITGKGIRLGMSKKELENILGTGTVKKIKDNQILVEYIIDDNEKSTFLKKYNYYVYYGLYHFQNDSLMKFEFGFEYP